MNTSPESREYWRAVEDDRQPRSTVQTTTAQLKDLFEQRDRARARRRMRVDQDYRQHEEHYHDRD
jgi:hypothetical protein